MNTSENKKGRVLRKLLVVVPVLLVIALVGVPLIAAPFVKDMAVSAIEENTGGSATIDSLSFNVLGSAQVGGVNIADGSGRPFASLDTLDAKVAVLSAIGGSIDLNVAVDGFQIELWQDEDGTWSVPSPEADGAGAGSGTPSAQTPPDVGSSEAPNVRASVAVTNGSVVLHGLDGKTSVKNITVAADVDSLERPAKLHSSFDIEGPGGPAGRLSTDADLTLAHGGELGADAVRGDVRLDVEAIVLDAFAPLITGLLPVESLSGKANGTVELELTGGLAVVGNGRFTVSDLKMDGPRDAPAAHIEEAVFTADASVGADGTGTQTISLALDRFFELTFNGTTDGLGSADAAHLNGTVDLRVGAKRVAELVQPWVELQEGIELGGNLTGSVAIDANFAQLDPKRASVQADLGFKQLSATQNGEEVPIGALANATFGTDCSVDLESGALELSRLAMRAGAALQASGQASIHGMPGMGADDGQLEVRDSRFEIQADLARLQKNLDAVLGDTGTTIKGKLAATLTAEGSPGGPVAVRADVDVTDFTKNVILEDGSRWRIQEPSLRFGLDAEADVTASSMTLRKASIESSAASGEISGRVAETANGTSLELRGDLGYIPDRVAAMLGPLIPGELSGAEREPITFELTGTTTSFELQELARACEMQAKLGVGRFTTTGLQLEGEVDLSVSGGVASVEGNIDANGGTLALDTKLGVAESAELTLESSQLRFDAKDIGANAAMSPMLATLHPAFATAKAVKDAELDGIITTDLEFSYDGPLTLEALAGGWEALPKQFIQGRGEFAMRGAAIRGMPLFDQLLEELGLDADETLDIDPIGFAVTDGRVSYSEPWRWKIDDAETTFTGSVGLDQTLDLNWTIPITKKLASKQRLLSFLEGQAIEVPIGGTATRPRIDWNGILGSLAEAAAQDDLEGRLGLGGGDGSPNGIFERANELWKQGEKEQAAALYQELRKNFKVSLVYALNKDRIDKRAKYQPN